VKHGASSTLNVTLTNPGTTPLSLARISIVGVNAAAFSQSNNCGGSLAAGAKCTIAVKFSPSTTGSFGANLTVVDNAQAGGGTQTVPLSGNGNAGIAAGSRVSLDESSPAFDESRFEAPIGRGDGEHQEPTDPPKTAHEY